MLFGFYEMTGLLGLGPGRNDIRAGLSSLVPYLPILLGATACIAATWVVGFLSWAKNSSRRNVIAAVFAALVPLLILTTIGAALDFRVLGRHLSPMIPAVLLPLAAAFEVNGRMAFAGRLLGSASLLLMIGSSLQLRFHHRHDKDNFRDATALAIKALSEGKRVWWQADMNATRYYAFRAGGLNQLRAIQVLESDPPTGLMFTDVMFVNRPDLYFAGKDHRGMLRANFFKLTHSLHGFEVWESE